MKFFSKTTFLCNLCFIAFIILQQVEKKHSIAGNKEAIIPLPALQGSLVVLGILAVIINFAFLATCGVLFLLKKNIPVAKWLLWANLLFLLVQIFYFKLY